jgi:exopolysaccharide transport family protein
MSANSPSARDVDIDLGRLFAGIARDWRRIVVVALAMTVLAFAVTSMLTSKYMGETRILIETRESELTRIEPNGQDTPAILDQEGVTSQVEVISSSDIVRKVVRDFDLTSRREFNPEPNVFARGLIMVGLLTDPSTLAPEDRAMKAFRERLDVYRVDNSRVIVVEFSSADPELAAAVPNAMADAYIGVQQQAKQQSNTDATSWLEPEIADLREKVKEAEERVADFRGKSDLLIGQNNSVLATQQLSELSTELSRVRANRSAAEANAEAVRAALRANASLDTLPAVMQSGLIQNLRERDAELRGQIADLSTTLLSSHPRLRALNSQLADLDAQITSEVRKILAGVEAEARAAKAREDSLVADLNRLKAESARADSDLVQLRAFEREAAAQRELLESYLTRYREATSRGDRNYLPADARVFSRAGVPAEPYFPKVIPITISAFAASLLLMVVYTLLRELFSGRAMVPAQGSRPELAAQLSMPAVDRTRVEPAMETAPIQPAHAEPAPVEPAPAAAQRTEDEPSRARKILGVPQPAAMRAAAAAAAALAPRPPRRPIGEVDVERAAETLIAGGTTRAIFVSPEGDEGAAASVLVAREIADAGLRVLLLDLTGTGAASRPMLESAAYPGITNLLVSEAAFADVIHNDLYSGAAVIPVGTANAARAMRAAERLPIILQSLNTAYDLVVVECGATGPDGIRRLVGSDTALLVAAIDPTEEVEKAAAALEAGGLPKPTVVSPAGKLTPPSPGRTAA